MNKLKYCDKKLSNTGSCSNLATYICIKVNKNTLQNEQKSHRCEEHKNKCTSKYKIISESTLDQSLAIKETEEYLNTLIGKEVVSSMHRRENLVGVYVKINSGGIMCRNTFNQKWRFVYSHQIKN